MKTEERIAAGVSLLMWILVYLFAITVLLMDLLVWRPG
jgi:hypothetical protein